MSLIYLVPFMGILSFLTPCMWNVNLLFRAYVKKGYAEQIPLLFLSRFILFNMIAFFFNALSESISFSERALLVIQTIVAGVFIFGFPLMKRLGFAPLDLSPQHLFPKRRLPPGISLGFSLPYCSIPFVALLGAYSLHFKNAFLLFNLYALSVTLPTLLLLVLPERFLKTLTSLISSVPAITGFMLVLAMGSFVDFGHIGVYISSLLQGDRSLMFLVPVMFSLGFFTSLGPSTLPFLPVVFGLLVTKHSKKFDVFISVVGFSVAFVITHASVGALASLGVVVLSDVFKTDLFNLLLSGVLFVIALNLLNVLPLSFEMAKLNPFSNAGASSFILGVAYTFSLCPSCTSLLLGAVVLSASTGSVLEAVFLMGIYAIGRSVPIFLSGFVVTNLSSFLRENYLYVNRIVGIVFLILSGYFLKNFLEVVL